MTVLPDKLCKFPVIVHTGKTFGFLSNLLQFPVVRFPEATDNPMSYPFGKFHVFLDF